MKRKDKIEWWIKVYVLLIQRIDDLNWAIYNKEIMKDVGHCGLLEVKKEAWEIVETKKNG